MSQNMEFQGNKDLFSLKERLKKLEKTIKEEIKEYTLSLEKEYSQESVIQLLTSIPGIGFKSAFTIWTEIGDINRFNSPKKLVAFAGLDPRIRQSGHCLNNQGKLTKRGSPHLRQALFVAASIARMHDPELKAYYEKKRSEGKKYTVAVCAVARKLINRIYIVWKRQTPYVKRGIYELNIQKVATEMATT